MYAEREAVRDRFGLTWPKAGGVFFIFNFPFSIVYVNIYVIVVEVGVDADAGVELVGEESSADGGDAAALVGDVDPRGVADAFAVAVLDLDADG